MPSCSPAGLTSGGDAELQGRDAFGRAENITGGESIGGPTCLFAAHGAETSGETCEFTCLDWAGGGCAYAAALSPAAFLSSVSILSACTTCLEVGTAMTCCCADG